MKTILNIAAVILLTVATMTLAPAIASAQDYLLPWSTIAGGGGYSGGGVYDIEATIGQADAGAEMSGGNYQLAGGFLADEIGGGGPQTVTPDSINVFRGIQIGGTLDDAFESDNSRMLFNPGLTLSSSEAPVWLIFDGTLPNDSPSVFEVVIESQAGTPGLTGTLEAWAWDSGSYDVLDESATSFNNDSVVTVDLSESITKFVQSGTGAVRTRIGWRKTGLTINFPWEVRLDQMIWQVQ